MSLTALIILHPGFEEIEAITPIDLLSRADVEVIIASVGEELLVTGRSGISVQATHLLSEVLDRRFDAVILPGGPGIQQIRKNAVICELFREHSTCGALIACICAAPLLLLDAQLLDGKAYTAHTSTLKALPHALSQPVVQDGNLLTSRGAGTATEFSLALLQNLCGDQHAKEIADSICWPHAMPPHQNNQ
ncbi:MAG: DJ-1 family glyoxalase III [Opitutaceae bacterium]